MFAFDLDIMTDMKLLAFEVANQNNFTLLLWSDHMCSTQLTSQSLLLSKNKLFIHKSACLSQNFSPPILANCPPPSHFCSSTRLSELRLYQARSQRSPLLKRRKSIDSAALHLRIGQSMAYENLPCLASSLLVSSHSAVPGDDLSCGSRVKVTVDR